MKQLSRAGRLATHIKDYTVEKTGKVFDIVINERLDEKVFNEIYSYIVDKYSYMILQLRTDPPTLRLIPIRKGNPKIKQIILLLTTIVTIFLTGYGITISFYELLRRINNQLVINQLVIIEWSIIYTALFLFALGFHEFGHMFSSKKSGVIIEGPYFIPAPPIQLGFIGTLGAVISMKSLPPTRRDLAKLGISGPLFGYIVALIIGFIGVMFSPTIPISMSRELVESGQASEIGFMPLTMILLLLIRNISSGNTVLLHPLAFISFIIFIVTFLNLLPIGQLDGGHVVRSFTTAYTHELIGYFIIISTAVTGVFLLGTMAGQYYIALSIILVIFKLLFGRHPHPGPANQFSSSKDYSILLAYILLIVLTLPLPV
ncbi:site-2 protease family protein [Staphylothermus hellenicus]|uniref:Peptidase M50 n=1 Tax=Staphylothermus hellenicus (strain DSM 12710 / JCM 10830 / BK20S6-10-b1 / P8) TaxID=591019 RepID=D7D936_STAHD|nr:site-2 protease family protein [Staphylothermus hellenicus]ADI32282.1 peptidase M50 [Staphylothermus hellenicus DSM 12710]